MMPPSGGIPISCLSEPDVGMPQGSAQKYFRQLIKGVVSTAAIKASDFYFSVVLF